VLMSSEGEEYAGREKLKLQTEMKLKKKLRNCIA